MSRSPPGDESVVEIVYRVPSIIDLDSGDLSFVLVPQKPRQPGPLYGVDRVPEGFEVEGPSEISGRLEEPIRIAVAIDD